MKQILSIIVLVLSYSFWMASEVRACGGIPSVLCKIECYHNLSKFDEAVCNLTNVTIPSIELRDLTCMCFTSVSSSSISCFSGCDDAPQFQESLFCDVSLIT